MLRQRDSRDESLSLVRRKTCHRIDSQEQCVASVKWGCFNKTPCTAQLMNNISAPSGGWEPQDQGGVDVVWRELAFWCSHTFHHVLTLRRVRSSLRLLHKCWSH